MKLKILGLCIILVILNLNLCIAGKIKTYEEHSLRPKITWVTVKGATSYQIKFKKINVQGQTEDTVIKDTIVAPLSSYQPDFDLEKNQTYQVTVESNKDNDDKVKWYIKTSEQVVYVHALDLKQDNNLLTTTARFNYDSAEMVGDGSGTLSYRASLNIPDGATITKLRVFYQVQDTSPTVVELKREAVGDFDASVMASIALPSTLGYGISETTEILQSQVILSGFEYFIHVSNLDVGDGIQRIEVYYYE